MSSFQVFSQPLGDFGTNGYILAKDGVAIAIDAPPGSYDFYKNVLKQRNLKLKYLLLTHSHFDHISEAGLIQKWGVKVGIHPLDAPNCQKPGCDGLPLMMPVVPFAPDFLISQDAVDLEEFHVSVLHTPGHTPGGCCFMIGDVMFSGDTLFQGSIGNISFTTSDPEKMKKSLQTLLDLEKEYIVYPGHGPKTSLEKERKTLLYFIQNI